MRAIFCALFSAIAASTPVYGTTLVLKNGVELTGVVGKIPSLDSQDLAQAISGGSSGGSKLIYVVDDDLRRSFVSTYQVNGPRDDVEALEHILLEQPYARDGRNLGRLGAIAKAGPFDKYGRRTITLLTAEEPINVVQGITEVTPRFVRLKSFKPYVLDMRIATSSIPRDTLSAILRQGLNEHDENDRLRIVRLYLQSERYNDAEEELQAALADFPQLADLQQQLREIRQLAAGQRLDELKIRRDAGQHELVRSLIPKFPAEGVAGEILLEVQDLRSEYQGSTKQIESTITQIDQLVGELPVGRRGELEAFAKELSEALNLNNVRRLQDFARMTTKGDVDAEEKLAIALSGWLADGQSRENLAIARSMWRARALVRRYLKSDDPAERREIISDLKSEEAGSVIYVAQLLAGMLPPFGAESSDKAVIEHHEWVPGLIKTRIPNVLAGRQLSYLIQLPPEYDPYRRYPTIVTLHAGGTTPQQQIDWWAGAFNQQAKLRSGPASRFGYIVIAPTWSRDGQSKYEYSANEHAAVLVALRDAMSRYSIDTNRTFLSGHSIGGDAAWDIALAHPDLWAGVIPISATAARSGKQDPKYVSRYWKNAVHVPQYFVGGSKDTARIQLNSRDFDRYLKKPHYDTIIVEYLGRGHEHFQDEIHRIFDWMSVHERNFHPNEFEVVTMRPWDSFFWWLEVDGLPARSTVLPLDWPPKKARPLTISGRVNGQTDVYVNAGVSRATVLLSPPLVDFQNDVTVSIGNRRTRDVQPDLETILEDARTRHDRQHPFWAKVEVAFGPEG